MNFINAVFTFVFAFGLSEVRATGDQCEICMLPSVNTKDGKLRGTVLKSREDRDIFSFLGIPFAKPPIGELRFKPPSPFGEWKGIRNATKVHPVCPQRDIYRRSDIFEGQEDCLYLNVYTPKLPSKSDASLLPVMVFFHGGGWLCGAGNTHWYGPNVLLDREVVLVVTNYRLGALGFLSTGDDVVPGNNGLKDQNLALQWIQRNIEAFGGDSNSVTLFGESAGGASVHYHMLSPMSKGLFHKAIAMSGTSLCVWSNAPKDEPLDNAKKLADSFECPTESNEKMIECLRQVDAMEIVKHDVVFMQWDFDPMIPFKPTVEPNLDGAFLTKHPLDVITSGEIAQVPFITGITKQDGALRAAAILNNDDLLEELNSKFEEIVPISLMYDKTAEDIKNMTKEIKKFYFKNEVINWSKKDDFINMYTDGWFLNCADKTVQLHKKYTKQPIYYYLFSHRGVSSFTQIFGGGAIDYGVCHADDLQYLFPVGDDLFPDQTPSKEDLKVVKLFSTLFANFAKTGNPTPVKSDLISEIWKPVKTEDMEYYLVDAKSPGMRKGLFLDRAKFWRNLGWNSRAQPARTLVKEEL